ncbi:MAG: DUF4199 domain-containing protein [Woeseiaceae bacterium]
MKKYILIYGAIAGVVVICSMILGIVAADGEGTTASEAFGYLIMLIAFSLIFVAIKQYRDKEQGGILRFSQGVLLGIGVSAVAGVAYVIVWEIYLNVSNYAFINDYAAAILEQAKASGISDTDYAEKVAQMEQMKIDYANPVRRLPMTFLEIFPVGVLVTLISAGILRKSDILPA